VHHEAEVAVAVVGDFGHLRRQVEVSGCVAATARLVCARHTDPPISDHSANTAVARLPNLINIEFFH